MKKVLASILAMTALLGMLASCSSDGTSDETTAQTGNSADTTVAQSETVTEKDVLADFEGIDLGGVEFRFDISVNEEEWNTSAIYVMGPEEETGETINDLVYRRNMQINELLNATVKWSTSDLGYANVLNYVQKQVMAGEDTIDLYINDLTGLLAASINGYLFNVYGNNYDSNFDFDSDGWNNSYMDQLVIGNTKRYILVSDYFIDAFRGMHVMYFNKNMYQNNFGDPNELYDAVFDGTWDYDMFYNIVENSYVDENGNGELDKEDTYGLWTNSPLLLYYATDASTFSFDENGIPYFDINYDRNTQVEDWILKFYTTNGNFSSVDKGPSTTMTVEAFTSGKIQFTYWLKIADIEAALMRDMDGIGILPYPKLDEKQEEYYTQIHDVAEIGVIPITANPETVSKLSTYLQAMTEYSAEYLMPEYYETALKVKYAQDETSALMLDLIRECASSPFEFMFNSKLEQIIGDPLRAIVNQKATVYTSTTESKLPAAQKKLDELISFFTEQQ